VRGKPLTLGELASVWVDEPVAPFQIAMVGIFDGTPFLRQDGTLDLTRVRSELVHRARAVPTLRRRMAWDRPGKGRPRWVEDAGFAPERHVTRTSLPEGIPFMSWCGTQIVRPLDRDLPLWRAQVVDGLPGAKFGLLIVVHHAVADGLAGVALARALLDGAADGGSADATASARDPRPQPARPVAPRPRSSPADLGRRLRDVPARLHRRGRALADAAADFRATAPVTSLSRPIGPGRRLVSTAWSLPALRSAGHRVGATVNDLLLTGITGGLRELLLERGDDLGGLVLRASVPVGSKGHGQPDGILVLGLPVGEPDLLRQLAIVHEQTATLKTRLASGGGDVLDVLHLPTPAARAAVRWMRRVAARRINLFVTNVPGPAENLWLAGARLLEAVPVAPLVRGVPLGIAALSYAGTLHVSVNADAAVDDVDFLAEAMERSVDALLAAARDGARLPTVDV
jgi:WS/DGAT/MGAT family acyltransferase